MTGMLKVLKNATVCNTNLQINLPSGETSQITHNENVSLNNSLGLKNVIYIPTFKHNLLFVNKLCLDEKCNVVFYDNYCIIKDSISNKVRGIGK